MQFGFFAAEVLEKLYEYTASEPFGDEKFEGRKI
jgi:hypothetical protein